MVDLDRCERARLGVGRMLDFQNASCITLSQVDLARSPTKIQAFSVETGGTFDLDAELGLWFSGLGKVKFEFSGKTDVAYLNKLVAHHVL
jgi:hypothetical protein